MFRRAPAVVARHGTSRRVQRPPDPGRGSSSSSSSAGSPPRPPAVAGAGGRVGARPPIGGCPSAGLVVEDDPVHLRWGDAERANSARLSQTVHRERERETERASDKRQLEIQIQVARNPCCNTSEHSRDRTPPASNDALWIQA